MPASTVRPLDRTAHGCVKQIEDPEPARRRGNIEVQTRQPRTEFPAPPGQRGRATRNPRSSDEAQIAWAT